MYKENINLHRFKSEAWREDPSAFLERTYSYVLNRRIDSQGKKIYMEVLSQGWSYSHVLSSIVDSEEFKQNDHNQKKELQRFSINYKKAQKRNMAGWYFREVKLFEIDSETERQRRTQLLATKTKNREKLYQSNIEWLELFDILHEQPRKFRDRILAKILNNSQTLNESPIASTSINLPLIQYWDTESIPEDVLHCMNQWQSKYPDKYLRFSDETAKEFIRDHYPQEYVQTYEKCWHPAMKCDFFRLCFLYINGGYYIDADEIPKSDLPTIEQHQDHFLALRPFINKLDGTKSDISVADYYKNYRNSSDIGIYFGNSPIITTPQNPVIFLSLTRAKDLINSEKSKSMSLHGITGPTNITGSVITASVMSTVEGFASRIWALEWRRFAHVCNEKELSYKNDKRNWRTSQFKPSAQD